MDYFNIRVFYYKQNKTKQNNTYRYNMLFEINKKKKIKLVCTFNHNFRFNIFIVGSLLQIHFELHQGIRTNHLGRGWMIYHGFNNRILPVLS